MSHHYDTKVKIQNSPKTLGTTLGRLAIKQGLSVQDIAKRLGASRMTVYNWFYGKPITNSYRNAVDALIQELKAQ